MNHSRIIRRTLDTPQGGVGAVIADKMTIVIMAPLVGMAAAAYLEYRKMHTAAAAVFFASLILPSFTPNEGI